MLTFGIVIYSICKFRLALGFNALVAFGLLLSCTNAVVAQTPEGDVSAYFAQVRANQNPSSLGLVAALKSNPQALALIRPFTNDTLVNVRSAAFSLASRVGQQTTISDIRREAVSILLEGGKDADSGINGLVASAVTRFSHADFKTDVLDSLRALLQRVPPHYDKWVKAAGYLGITDQVQTINLQIQSGALKSKSYRWAALLALSRLGDEAAINQVMDRVTKLGINDDVVYEVLPGLAYTRHPKAVKYLVDALQSDAYQCESADPESVATIPCAYRIMELLAPIIKDFPLQVDGSGDINTKDYAKALRDARAWFSKNQSSYQIDNERF